MRRRCLPWLCLLLALVLELAVTRPVSASWAQDPAPKHAFASSDFQAPTHVLRACPRDPHLHWRDPVSGYELVLGCRKARDPAGFVDSTNLYSYVTNRPTVAVDPSGLALLVPSQYASQFEVLLSTFARLNDGVLTRHGPEVRVTGRGEVEFTASCSADSTPNGEALLRRLDDESQTPFDVVLAVLPGSLGSGGEAAEALAEFAPTSQLLGSRPRLVAVHVGLRADRINRFLTHVNATQPENRDAEGFAAALHQVAHELLHAQHYAERQLAGDGRFFRRLRRYQETGGPASFDRLVHRYTDSRIGQFVKFRE